LNLKLILIFFVLEGYVRAYGGDKCLSLIDLFMFMWYAEAWARTLDPACGASYAVGVRDQGYAHVNLFLLAL
jgi:hypothetical protein